MLIFLLLTLFFGWTDADPSFRSFCANPPNFGKGELKGNTGCIVTYNVKSHSDQFAHQFCDRQHPYSLEKVEVKGDRTVCHIAVYYECGVNERLIGDRCFAVQREAHYAISASTCSDTGIQGLKIHKIHTMFEQKWIAAFFTSYKMIWIGNTGNELKNLKVASFKGKIMHNVEGRLVDGKAEYYALVTNKGAMAAVRGGTITSVSKLAHLPVMCSRSAPGNEAYPQAITAKMEEVGVKSHLFKDYKGKNRPFTILRLLVEFEMGGEFNAGGKRLHKACHALKNGYAATPLDFQNVDDFKKMLKEEKVNIVGVPGQRISSITTGNDPTCVKAKHTTNLDVYRQYFNFELNNGGLKSAKNEKYWRESYPDKYCADTPRTALGFSQKGLVDIPNSARMFVVCTYGEESMVTEGDYSAKCSKFATYNKEKDTCTCKPPFSDITTTKMFVRTKEDKNNLQGAVCINCQRAHDHEIAIVIENNWNAHKTNDIAITHILRLLSYIGLVSKSRLKLFMFDDKVTSGKYSTPAGRVPSIRNHFEDEYKVSYRQGALLAPALRQVYRFFKNKSTDRKLVVLILNSKPSDLDAAIKEREKLDEIKMQTLLMSFLNDNDLKRLSSFDKLIDLREPETASRTQWDIRSDAMSHVQQAMLRNSCTSK